jgi:hypothetical protein
MKKGLLFVAFIFCAAQFVQAQQDTTYKAYLGLYKFSDGSVVPTVEITGDSLKALTMSSEAGNSPLEFVSADKFTITNFNGTADFKRNDTTKQIISIHIEAMGYILDGIKLTGSTTFIFTKYYRADHFYAVLKK